MLDFIQQNADLVLSNMAVDSVISLIEHFAKNAGITETNVNSEEFFPAFKNYSGPMRKFCNDMNKNYIQVCQARDTCQEWIGESYVEPTHLSHGVAQFLGLGAYVLSGGSFLGASAQLATNKIVEPLARKAQYYLSEEYHPSNNQHLLIDDLDEIEELEEDSSLLPDKPKRLSR